MLTRALLALMATASAGCAVHTTQSSPVPEALACKGSIELPAAAAQYLAPTDNPALLAQALGEPEKGGLCQAQVYTVQEGGMPIYRAWNSTNAGSQFGRWWAFEQPTGKVADYREDYEICYQWSPLDKLSSCQLQAGATVVVGTGQSARCSEYLTYGASAALQIYIESADKVVANCVVNEAVFGWQ